MAKLKAHGVELFRIAREIGPEELTLKAEKSGFGPLRSQARVLPNS